MGEYQKISLELINHIHNSGLLSICNELNICITGDGEFSQPFDDNKIKIYRLGGTHQYEFPTLQMIEDCVSNDDDTKILYLNTLGVTGDSIFKKSWRKYLSYFNIINFNECVKALDYGFDTCGVDWRTDPLPHYSGNFWWANSKYLKTLPKIQTLNKENSPRVLTLRHNAEMYIGMNPDVKPRILHQSDISQYERHMYEYNYENYFDKISLENIVKST